jgi:tetratricopeptide (TPR) repeat protein
MNTLNTVPTQKAAAHHAAFIPTPPSDQFKRAVKLHQQGDLAMAEFMYRQILREEPDYIEVTYLLGLLANQTGRPAEAVERINKYLEVRPDDAQAVAILGLCYFDLKEYATAAQSFSTSLEMNPGSDHIMQNLAKAQFQLGDYEAARLSYFSLLLANERDTDVMQGLAVCEQKIGNYDVALGILENAIVLEPRSADLHFTYGNVLWAAKDHRNAVEAYGAAITLKPDFMEAYANCASTLKDMGMISEAMALYDTALKLCPTHPEANYNRALLHLSDLKVEEGWKLYEYRLDVHTCIQKFLGGKRIKFAPDWDGCSEPKSLLVVGEQGLGDQIFFAGMLTDLMKQVPDTTVCVEPRLIPLLKRSMPTLNFIGPDQLEKKFEAQIYLGSLGRLFRPNVQSLDAIPVAYLQADSVLVSELRSKVQAPGKLVCGISWISKNSDHGDGKSLSLESLLPVLNLPGVKFVNLQYGDTTVECDELTNKHGIKIHHLEEIDNQNDLDGLAALIAACDIVVTVSNTTAHLAAALGKPALVMLPNNDSLLWYWHRDSHTTPWYPSVRLFRRSDTGRWEDVIDAVALTLAGII